MKPSNAEIPVGLVDPGRMVALNPHDERYVGTLVSGKWGIGKSVLVSRCLADARGFTIDGEEDQ